MKNFVEIIAENSQDIQKIKMSRIDIKQNKNGDTDLDSVLQYINNLQIIYNQILQEQINYAMNIQEIYLMVFKDKLKS